NRLKEPKFYFNAATSFSKLHNAVRIMSINKTTVLEFPVCFIANFSRQFNKDKDDVLLHPNFGIGIKLLDKERGFRYNTYQRKAIKIELERAALSEELRVLYVAMTRAKEKLFLITSLKDPAAKLAALAERIINNGVIPPNAVRTSGSFSDWLLLCVLSKRQNDILYASKDDIKDLLSRDLDVCKMDFVDLVAEDGFSGDKNANIQKENFDSTKLGINNVDDNLLNLMKQRFSYTYKMQNLCTIPTKVTVTDIVAGKNNKYLDFSRSPDFSAGNNITPTQLGTAMHTFLQFADFDSARKNLSKEMDRLISKGYLQEELSQKLNWRNIQRFLDSDLVTRILKSTLVKKEYEFSIRMPINEYTGDLSAPYQNENIILQGSIDCAFIEDNEWVIVDYKTDKFKSLDEIKNKYSKQLKLYSMALRKCTCTSVKQTVLYLFHTGEQIVLLE
ncbi:MAG: PD-(D/E)XK nuclease family protein, partial [Clostridia bacterium]|nr:PD-(D/E)XK nuclease family protein [Clostridia bacterium]